MMGEWKKYKLKDVCTILGDGLHGTPIYDDKGEFFFINGNNLKDGRISIKNDTKRVPYSEANKYKKPLNNRTILVSINGTIGNVAKYQDEKCILGKSACFFNVKENVDLNFIYYVVANQQFKNTITQLATGTTIKNVSLETMRNYTFCIPPLSIQKQIGKILSSFDDKIELNRRINDNLEQQAITIFDNMFPTVASGEDVIGDIITPKRGKSLLSKDAVEGNVPVVAGGLEPATYHNESNTIAPVVTISASGANAGYVNLWHIPVWSSDSSFIDSAMTSNIYFWYVMLKKRQKEIFDAQTGSAQPHIYPKHIAEMPLGKFELSDVEKFTEIVTPMFEIRGKNLKESKRLAAVRDLLLPKLMSGKLKINDINN
ncbi:restriction endonuclease subunit S [Porphyromonas gingivalis]|uniref:restriction endonuclease subunit S n=1 Tax=Porphyromonas gingivalis TaxID=837 RepID=UPI001B8B4264|nr:restriction endonuclease subunit S [Porphyromonas gingivalis]QUI88775.1 restriction endonuclease subunit S [Porphyromonas gingivalis]QUI90718.1 restriction endonuclease subunit S [Porphyromonas gingivalis]